MASRFKRFLREVKEARKRRLKASLDVDADGFTFTRGKLASRVAWSAVTMIAAGTHAMISGEVFFVMVGVGGEAFEIDEFVEGFSNFERALIGNFPSVRDRVTALQTSSSADERLEVVWTSGAAR